MRPDLLLFQEHVNIPLFQQGVDDGKWGIYMEDPAFKNFPNVFIWVAAAEKMACPGHYDFKFEFSGYSNNAPAGCPWDLVDSKVLDKNKWPKGNRLVSRVFNPAWNPAALYAPCDRIAMNGHGNWKNEYPDLWWQPHHTIVNYLNFLHTLLNSSDYARS